MAIVRRQSAKGKNGVPPAFAVPPLPGSGMLFLSWVGNLGPPAGWNDLYGFYLDVAPGGNGFRVFWRVAQAGDPAVIPPPVNPNDRWIVAEWPGVSAAGPLPPLPPPSAVRQGPDAHPHVAIAPVHIGEILIVGAAHHNNTTEANFAPDPGFTVVERQDFGVTVVHGMVDRIDAINTGAYDPGVSTAPFNGLWCAGALAWAGASGGPPNGIPRGYW